MTFIDAKVDKSLGNIRENIRKGANQKHISTSIVDPLKDMKKTGTISKLYIYVITKHLHLHRSKCACIEANPSAQVSRRAGQGERDEVKSALVECKVIQSNNRPKIRLVITFLVTIPFSTD